MNAEDVDEAFTVRYTLRTLTSMLREVRTLRGCFARFGEGRGRAGTEVKHDPVNVGYNQFMSDVSPATGDQLASALHVLGVNFLIGGTDTDESLHNQPARLIAALAESREARLRLSLIPLFLEHPEFAVHVRKTAESLDKTARTTLQCYYSAAVFLQKKYSARLNILIGEKSSLPDLFSRDLGLQITIGPEKGLQLLAQRHQELCGAQVNWLGTYQHAAQIWMKGLEIQKS